MENESSQSPARSPVTQGSKQDIVESFSPSKINRDGIGVHVSCIPESQDEICGNVATQENTWMESPGYFIDSQSAPTKPVSNNLGDDKFLNQSKLRWLHEAKKQGYTFGKIMIPVAIISLWMFGLYAILSWLIPSVLCKSFAEDLSVSFIIEDNKCLRLLCQNIPSINSKMQPS